MSGNNMHIFNDEYTRRKSNYIEDPKIAKEIYGEEASTNEASNQMIQRTNLQKWYYDKNQAML